MTKRYGVTFDAAVASDGGPGSGPHAGGGKSPAARGKGSASEGAANQAAAKGASAAAALKSAEVNKMEKTATTKQAAEMSKAHGVAAQAQYRAAERHSDIGNKEKAAEHQAKGNAHVRQQADWKTIKQQERGYR